MSILGALTALGSAISRLLVGVDRKSIEVGGDVDRSIQQVGEGNVAQQTIHSIDLSAGREAVQDLRSALAELGLSAEQRGLLDEEVEQIDGELQSAAPSGERIGGALKNVVAKLKMANVAVAEGSRLGRALVTLGRAVGEGIEGLPGV